MDHNGDYYGDDYDHDNCAKDVRKDAKALVKESDRIVGYKSLSTIYCYYTTTRYLFLLYGGNISYNIILCCMVERYYIYVIWWTALVER